MKMSGPLDAYLKMSGPLDACMKMSGQFYFVANDIVKVEYLARDGFLIFKLNKRKNKMKAIKSTNRWESLLT